VFSVGLGIVHDLEEKNLDIVGFPREVVEEHFKDDDTKRPDIKTWIRILLTKLFYWCIVMSIYITDSGLKLSPIFGSSSEISNFEDFFISHVFKENILGLQISVNNTLWVDKLERFPNNLN
jgi:hypothetical protein